MLGFLLYGIIWLAYASFYEDFGVEPEDVGVTYLAMTVRAAFGAIALMVAFAFGFAIMVAISYSRDLDESIQIKREPAFPALFNAYLTASLGTLLVITSGATGLLYPTAFASDYTREFPWFILPAPLAVGGAFILSFFLPGSTTDHALREAINKSQRWQLSKRVAFYRLSIVAIVAAVLSFGYPLPQAAGDRLARDVAQNGGMRNLLAIHVVSVDVNWGQMKAVDLPPQPRFVYLGQSNGLAVLYEQSRMRIYRVPISAITLESSSKF
jgi:hypothetical protein